MLKAEICKNRIQAEGWEGNDDLLAKIRTASGRDPEVFSSASGEPQEYYFRFDDGSTLNVDFLGGKPNLWVQVQPPTR